MSWERSPRGEPVDRWNAGRRFGWWAFVALGGVLAAVRDLTGWPPGATASPLWIALPTVAVAGTLAWLRRPSRRPGPRER